MTRPMACSQARHMRTTKAITTSAKPRARHFDRGFRLALPAVALLAACSSSLTDPATTGSAGSGGATGGFIGECGGLSGAGNCARGGTGGSGGSGGTTGAGATGVGGSGGSAPLPECAQVAVAFGVCFVNDAEDRTRFDFTAQTSGTATIEAVGSGNAPASCRDWRAVGIRNPSDWWIQARAADKRLWTMGVNGLGSTPPVRVGDTVTLDVDWRINTTIPGAVTYNGKLQLSDAAGTPLLWAESRAFGGLGSIPDPSTWISFASGGAACSAGPCFADQQMIRSNVIATVNGNSATLPPNGVASLDNYTLGVTAFSNLCGDYAPPFEAAAAKVLF